MFVFLDIDGVLNTEADWKRLYTLNPKCVKAFVKRYKGSKVVLTSSWKSGYSPLFSNCSAPIQDLISALKDGGISVVGRIEDGPRGTMIAKYVKEHNLKPDNYVILDDDRSEFDRCPENLILINSKTGLV